jgi:hypothetical protein
MTDLKCFNQFNYTTNYLQVAWPHVHHAILVCDTVQACMWLINVSEEHVCCHKNLKLKIVLA